MDTSLAATSLAELVVHNGRKQGTRRPLKEPVTIIGSSKGCDVRLDVPSVRPIHCIIGMSPAGPQVRSWGPDDTFVNGAAVVIQLLRDGDLLRVGPFEFEIHWTVPLAEPVEGDEPASFDESDDRGDDGPILPAEEVPETPEALEHENALPPFEQIARLEDLRHRLRDDRAAFRRERQKHTAELASERSALAEMRQDLEQREDEVAHQRSRLHFLRARFIKRWKRHWSAQRATLAVERERLHAARNQFELELASFEQERTHLFARTEIDSRRIEHGWEQLRSADRQARNASARREAALDQREEAIAEAEVRLRAEQLQLRAERMQFESQSAHLRVETDGMEARVANLREVLSRLDTQRAESPTAPAEPQTASNPFAPGPNGANAAEQQALLEKVADELADQRTALAEQIDRLATVREAWRIEESQLVGEMAALGEQLRRREEQIAEDEIASALDRQRIERDSEALRQLQQRLDVRLARQDAVEARWRSELGQRDVDLQQRWQILRRREQALNELCRRWRERRRREIVELRDAHQRCEKLRVHWAGQEAKIELREKAIDLRQLDLAGRALVLEKARQHLLESNKDPLLARKKMERMARHVRSAIIRAEGRLERREQAIEAERTALVALVEHADRKIEEAANNQGDYGDRYNELERREYLIAQEAHSLTGSASIWSVQRAMFERECSDLRKEVERLAAIIIETALPDMIQMTRAA